MDIFDQKILSNDTVFHGSYYHYRQSSYPVN